MPPDGSDSELRRLQLAFTGHLRDPDNVPVPAGLDPRRMGIYSELIFNNVSSLLEDFFPVIRSILDEASWHRMVRNFFISHQSQTPYFMELSGEFVEYLAQAQLSADFPDFLVELAHYEWLELALFTMDEDLPDEAVDAHRLADTPLGLSPLAQPFAYRYPVHRIGPGNVPDEPGEQPTLLMVARDVDDSVRFFELQPLAFQLLQQIQQQPGLVAGDWLSSLADELGAENKSEFVRNGIALLQSFNEHRLLVTENP